MAEAELGARLQRTRVRTIATRSRRRRGRRWRDARGERAATLRELYGVRLARELDDAEELSDAVRKLRTGRILRPE